MLRSLALAIFVVGCSSQTAPAEPASEEPAAKEESKDVQKGTERMRATWKGQVLAESEETVVVEGNHYFPPTAVKMDFLKMTDKTYECSWKGHAKYYNVEVGGEVNESAAWVYPKPEEEAAAIAGRIAFWKGVEVAAVSP